MPEEGVRKGTYAFALSAIFVVAAAVRIAALALASEYPTFRAPDVDSLVYHRMGQSFADGDLLLGRGVHQLSPGYSYFVGLIYGAFGSGPWPIRVVQLLLGFATIALILATARRLFGRAWALLPGGVAAVYGPFLFQEQQILAETLGAFLYALVLWLAVRAVMDTAGARPWLYVGMAWAACVVTRPEAIVLGLALAAFAWRALSWRERAWALGFVFGPCLVAVLATTLRNQVVSGEAVALTDTGGINLYIGNGPGANGTFRVPAQVHGDRGPIERFAGFHRAAEREAGHALSVRQADRHWVMATVEFMADEPVTWLGIMVRKVHLYWNARELSNVHDYEFGRRINAVLGAPLVQFGWIAPWALVGMVLMCFLPRTVMVEAEAGRFVGVLTFATMLSVVLFFVVARYRIPAVPGLLLLATAAVRFAARLFAERHWRKALLLGVGLVLSTGLAWPVSVRKHFEDEYFKLGVGWHEEGNLPSAEHAYQQALQIDSGYLPAHNNLALLYERTGDLGAARRHWRTVLEAALLANDRERAALAERHLSGLDRMIGPAVA